MEVICGAADRGDLAEVERLVGQDPGLINQRFGGMTPLMLASSEGHVGVVRCLVDKGAAINEITPEGLYTALSYACIRGHAPVARLLLGAGAVLTVTGHGTTLLMFASVHKRLEIVRLLLGHTSAKATLNARDASGETALWQACYVGCGGVVRALLEGGADPTIADNDGTTPMAIAKQDPPYGSISAEGRRECVAALEVSSCLYLSCPLSTCSPIRLEVCLAWWQEAERAYLLWKARQVADQQGSGAVAVPKGWRGAEGEEGRALLDFAVHGLKGDLFTELMEMMG
jgi:uncharacterized protein